MRPGLPQTPVILVVIDTLRADHLSAYGYELETTPTLDEFANSSVLFEANTTQCNSTFPSLTSILTGLYPKTHRNYLAVPTAGTVSTSRSAACLAERLSAVGYHTIAQISHPSWSIVGGRLLNAREQAAAVAAGADARTGSLPDESSHAAITKGWDQFLTIDGKLTMDERVEDSRAVHTNARIFPLLDDYAATDRSKPLFAWVHYFDPHTDLPNVYDAPLETRDLFLEHHLREAGLERYFDQLRAKTPGERYAWIRETIKPPTRGALQIANGRACYDAEIRYCDSKIAQLFNKLREIGIWDEALVIVAADHGENMDPARGKHGSIAFTHKRLFEGVANTPLIIKLPGKHQAQRCTSLTQNIDLLPTVLEILHLEPDPALEGRSLVPLLLDPTAVLHERVFIESSDHVESAIKSDDLKYIDRGEDKDPLIYAWREDSAEAFDLYDASELEPRSQELAAALKKFQPIDTLRVRIEGMAERFHVSVEVYMPQSQIDEVVGVPAATLIEDRHRFVWEGDIGPEGKNIVLFPRRRNTEMLWRITHSAFPKAEEAVHLGQMPVARTPAIPIWRRGEQPAPKDVVLRMFRKDSARELSFQMTAVGGKTIEAELRYKRPGYNKDFEMLSTQGFEPLVEGRARVFSTRSRKTAQPVSATFKCSGRMKEIYQLFRIDGSWPDLDRVSIQGKAFDRSALEFVFPHPLDGRITSYLMVAPDLDQLPPGSISIWLETGGGGGAVDTSHLSLEELEQLRAMGYVGDDE